MHVVVATPGARSITSSADRSCSTTCARVVLDEADEMLDMGFAEELEQILAATPATRQTVLFSATLPPRIDAISRTPPERPGAHPDPPAADDRRAPPLVRAARVHRAALAQGGGARPRARHRGARRGDRVLPHARRGRQLDRDAERSRLSGRGAARRHEPGAARQGDGPPAQRHDRTARRDRRRRPRPRHRPAHPRRSTSTCPPRPRPTCTASAVSGAPGAKASRSRSPSRASNACSATSSASPSSRSRSTKCRPSPRCAPRQLELALDEVRNAAADGGLDRFRAMVETLCAELSVEDIAAGRPEARPRGPRCSGRRGRDPRDHAASEARRRGDARPSASTSSATTARSPRCTSTSAATPASVRRTWSVRSPTRPASAATRSARSSCRTGSRSSTCRATRPTR